MLCPKCGKKGFPVRIACNVCDATLPDAPAILETPEKRGTPKRIVCVKCGSPAMDARIACIHCDATFPPPFELSDEERPLEHDPNIAYYTIVCCQEACKECASFGGLSFLPSRLPNYRIPVPACKYPVCWCRIMGVYWDEGTVATSGSAGKEVIQHQPGDAADVAAFLERSGGAATAAQIDSYVASQSRGGTAPSRSRP